MQAALITGRERLELCEVAEPAPATDGVVVEIAYCGVCGTDVHAFTSGRPYPPAVCGHEWAGTVVAVGAAVPDIVEGDTVIVAVPPPCGECSACRRGLTEHCSAVLAVATGRDEAAAEHGGFAPRIAVHHHRVMRAHPALDLATLAQVEPVAVSLHAVRRSGLAPGDLTVVQGAGPVGLTTLLCTRAAGASTLIVVEPDERRRAIALAMGADLAVAPAVATVAVEDHSQGLGADVVFECAGRPDTVQTAVNLARKGGTVGLIGLADTDAMITPGSWLRREITLVASIAYTRDDFAAAQELLAEGRIDLRGMHTSTVGLDALPALFAELAGGATDQIKVLVDPRA